MISYLIGTLIAIIVGICLYFIKMCWVFDCIKEGLPWKGIVEPLLNWSLAVWLSSYNAFVFIIPSIIVSLIGVFIFKKKKNIDN